MFTINDDNSIYATRGDIVFFAVTAEDDGVAYKFLPGDVLRIKVYGKKDAENVVLQKDFPVTEECEAVEIFLSEEDTKIGEVISKPKDYWYEVELNPGDNPQTIVGYDEDGAKVFKLFPEGDDIPEFVPDPEDFRVMDDELDVTSTRPVQNQAIAKAVVRLNALAEETAEGLAIEKARFDNLISEDDTTVSKKLGYLDFITESTRAKIDAEINSDGVHASIKVNLREANLIYGGTDMDVFIIPAECRPIDTGVVHTADGLEYSINYDTTNNRYVLNLRAQDDVTVAPSGAGSVTFGYPLGDYELKDIRVGADGKIYPTAGEAMRAQFETMKTASEVVTPQMFGAVGDGKADDTEAIQKCIDENEVVFFPKGEYKITAPLEVPTGRTIMGDNKYYTKVICDNCDAVHFEQNAERGNIKGISFWGDKSAHSVFVFNANVHWTFSDIWARDFGAPYFYANGCGHNNNIIIENSEFEHGGVSCVEMINAAAGQINNITIRSCNISGFEKGICITGNNITITACTIQNVEFGIYIDPAMTKDLSTNAHNSRAITINSNYFELVRKSFIYINSYYDPSNIGFISGISIISNYGAPHAEADTSYPCIKFDANQDIYSSYRLDGGSMIAAVFYAANHFDVNGGKVLIDGAGILPEDCIFFTDGKLGNNRGYSLVDGDVPYTLQNMGNATVINKFERTVSALKLYSQRLPDGASVTLDSATIPPNSEVFCHIPNDRIVDIRFVFNSAPGDSYHYMKVRGHLRSGEVVDVIKRYIKTNSADEGYELSVGNGTWGYIDGVFRPAMAFDSFDIYIKSSPTEELTIINPVVIKGG